MPKMKNRYPRRKRPELTRENILSFTRPEGECLIWTGATNPAGYAQYGDQIRGVHRKSFELFTGVSPAGKFVCHRCDRPSCINPDHLFLGDPLINNHDMIAKGRARIRGRKLPMKPVSEQTVIDIRSSAESISALAKRHGVSPAHAWKIRNGSARKSST